MSGRKRLACRTLGRSVRYRPRHVIGQFAGAALTAVAIVGKVLSGLGCPRRMNRLAVGFGMMPRGEVGLIFAGIGKSIGVVDDGLFSAVIVLVMVTTLLTPLALRWTLLPKAP